jgi:hypothetical protein
MRYFKRLLCLVATAMIVGAMFAFVGCTSEESYQEVIENYNSSRTSNSSSSGNSGSSSTSGLSNATLVTLYCRVSNVTVTKNSLYTICTGTITNSSTNYTFRYIKVKGAFKDSTGTVVDTDWSYGIGSEGLAPGESKTFRLSVTKNTAITSCTVTTYI